MSDQKWIERANQLMSVDVPEDTPAVVCGVSQQCWCHNCNKDVFVNGIPFSATRMILCPECGNKRCPKATDHNLACTNSNEPGQKGSTWENYPSFV